MYTQTYVYTYYEIILFCKSEIVLVSVLFFICRLSKVRKGSQNLSYA